MIKAMEEIKHNSIIESKNNSSRYKPFIDYLKENLGKLDDFIISKKEILAILNGDTFEYNEFKSEFDNTPKFHCLQILKSEHNSDIYHIIRKGEKIPQKYTKDVISDVVKAGYSTKNIQEIIEYWTEINNKATESINSNVTIISKALD